MVEQIGIVRNISNGKAEVEINRISGCGGGCKTCGGCNTPSHTLLLKNDVNANVGDVVKVKGETKNLLKYTAIVYLFPLSMLLVGLFTSNIILKNNGVEKYELISSIIGLLTMAISFLIVRGIDKKIGNSDEQAVSIIEIIN